LDAGDEEIGAFGVTRVGVDELVEEVGEVCVDLPLAL